MNFLHERLIKSVVIAKTSSKGQFIGDKDSIKKQNKESLLKGKTFFLANGRYRFIYTISDFCLVLLDWSSIRKRIKFLTCLSYLFIFILLCRFQFLILSSSRIFLTQLLSSTSCEYRTILRSRMFDLLIH